MIGVLPVDKPQGPTSHDVVAAARRALDERRIGHTGTLDPFATGLLLLCIGKATRIAEYLQELPKRYSARARLGETTDTDDLTGEVVERSEDWRTLDAAVVRSAFTDQIGERLQVPPTFSAKKVGGERLHRLARAGRAVEAEPVPVTIHDLRITAVALPEVAFQATCSSGTYIRAIARDAGVALGVGGHLVELRRTHIGDLDASDAIPVDRLGDRDAVADVLITPLDAIRHMARLDLDADAAGRIRHGQALQGPGQGRPPGPIVLAFQGELLAMGEVEGDRIRPRKVFT